MKIGNIVYVVDPFLIEVRRCRLIGEEQVKLSPMQKNMLFWKTKDFFDGSLNYSHKDSTFATIEEANEYIESLLDSRMEILKKKTDTKEKLIKYLYSLAVVSEIDTNALDYLEMQINKHTGVKI